MSERFRNITGTVGVLCLFGSLPLLFTIENLGLKGVAGVILFAAGSMIGGIFNGAQWQKRKDNEHQIKGKSQINT